MRLQFLHIENFRVIRKAVLPLSDAVIGVVGPNGSGKSSLVEAIAWALYGNVAVRSGKDEIKSAFASLGDDCRVSLGFTVNGDTYTIERTLRGPRERPEAQVLRGGRVEASGSVETARYAAGLLGLDWRGFLTSFLARQQELNALADLPPHQRRDHLAGMLGIERIDKVLQRVKQDRRLLDDRAALLAEQLVRREQVAEELARIAEHVARLENDAGRADVAVGAAETAHRRTEALWREHQEKRLACSEADAGLRAVREVSNSLGAQVDEASVRIGELEAAKSRLVELERATVSLDTVRQRRDKLRETAGRAELAAQLRSQGVQAEQEARSLAGQHTELGAELTRLQDVLRALPPDIEAQVQSVADELEVVRVRYADRRAALQTAETDLRKVTEQVEEISQIGPEAVCDRCHRPFGDDLPEIRGHLETEKKVLGDLVVARREELDATTRQGRDQRERLADLQKAAARRRDADSQAGHLSRQLADLDQRSATLTRVRQDLAARLESLGVVEVAAGEPARTEDELARLEKLRIEELQLRVVVAELPRLGERLDGLKSRLLCAQREITELETRIRTIGYDAALFVRLQDDLERTRRDLDAARKSHTEMVKELEIAQSRRRMLKEEQDRLQKTAGDLDACRGEIFYTEKLGVLFGDFRKEMIAGIGPRLADLAGRLMTDMSGGRYGLVELDPDYNLRIMDMGKYYGLDRFSGGEKDLASLCLRLSISLALTESAGLDRSFVILDEVFGSQDANRRELIVEALAGLKTRFPQMILITHLEELKHKVETLIEVVPSPEGWSEVLFNDSPTSN